MMTLTSKSSASWSDAMTFKLLNICLEVKKAFMNTSFGGFKKSEWKKINIDFNAAYNVGYDTTQIQSKVSDLKKKYVILLDLRSHGFEWDSETKRVIADEDVWAKYLVSHPQARCFKTSSFVFYDQMEALCSPLPQKATIQNDKREEISIMNEIINTSYDNNDNEGGTQTAAEPSQRSKKKAKLSREVEYQMPKNFAPYLGDSSITSLISSFPHDNTSSSITNASTGVFSTLQEWSQYKEAYTIEQRIKIKAFLVMDKSSAELFRYLDDVEKTWFIENKILNN